jgi:pyruvate kinase
MPHNSQQIVSLLDDLKALRQSCFSIEKEFQSSIAEVSPESRCSARNLLHYLALRQHDVRDLQSRLASLGLSSLGRSESSTLAGLESIISLLEKLVGGEQDFREQNSGASLTEESVDFRTGPALLAQHASDLMGPAPRGRGVRIMVTMPPEAAESYVLVKDLVETGMDVMRINCAHDAEPQWEAMIRHMRLANQETGKHCRILMDLAGPRLRTGSLHRGSHVVRWKVEKDHRGIVVAPIRIALAGKKAAPESLASADVVLPAPEPLLRKVLLGDAVNIKDSRNKKRMLTVTDTFDHGCFCSCEQGAYVLSRAEIVLMRDGKKVAMGRLGALPFVEEPIRLRNGDLLILTREDGKPGRQSGEIPHISCTLPEAFAAARKDQPIYFDDGKIEGCIREVGPDQMIVKIVHTTPGGSKLGSGKGINLPETDLQIGALTEKDKIDLEFVSRHSDLVGLSFVRQPCDVLELRRELAQRGRTGLGIILKIESRHGFEQLPLIMIAAMGQPLAGIMVARGDLAVEIGYERLAEVQEEILWLSEAAHMPVIWATQVLENLTKTGTPSRAEVTDAAMGVRAECVMLNKGEHVLEAVRFLDHVLHSMQAHQTKKRSMLRRLAVAQVNAASAASPR